MSTRLELKFDTEKPDAPVASSSFERQNQRWIRVNVGVSEATEIVFLERF
jgi:hypothetical protein